MDTSADGAALSDDSNATQADISGVDSPTPASDATSTRLPPVCQSSSTRLTSESCRHILACTPRFRIVSRCV